MKQNKETSETWRAGARGFGLLFSTPKGGPNLRGRGGSLGR